MRMTRARGMDWVPRRSVLPQAFFFLLFCGLADTVLGQAQVVGGQTAQTQRDGKQQGPKIGVPLDRLVAVVNDDVILQSDVDEELRLVAFQPFRDASSNSSEQRVVERLINRRLILQQALLQPDDEITDKQVTDEFAALRKDIPACKEYHCETDAGWERFVRDQGFTMEELIGCWRERMQVLRFIEERFRSGIEITPDQIKEYYEKTLLPQYASEHATAPKLETISSRIQEVLLQQQVTNLLSDWLKSLRAQGTVRTIQLNEATP